jgi:membrane protein DedA with SNARE-associated domain/rhodanese-related sulfurtransferase
MVYMNDTLRFLVEHGYGVTLGAVFLEQMGLPMPAGPVLMGMGALSRSGNVSITAVLLVALIGALSADLIWYYLGRHFGRSVLQMICRISLEPDYCVRRTEDAFVRRGLWTIPFAKFLPGLNAAAVPLAGMIKTGFLRFLAFDTAGLVVWAGFYATLGYVFGNQLEHLVAYLSPFGNSVLLFAVIVLIAYVGYKYIQRVRFLRTLAIDRITPEELRARMDLKEKVIVLDLRNQLDVNLDRYRIPGAFHVLPELLGERGDVPRDQEIVLYCTCPNEATSARVAQQLRRLGITRVRPLAGGFSAWRDRGFPIESLG